MRLLSRVMPLVLVLVVPVLARAQVSALIPSQAPPRDNPRQPATGTARIRGRIVAADTGLPLRRAVVRLSAPELRGVRTTTTDADGRYEFRDLPAAHYNVNATKGSYVNLSYGQRRPSEPARPLIVADQQTVEKIDIALPPGAVITGRVIDEYGDPVTDARVSALRNQYTPQGRRQFVAGRPGSTNDIGEFRIFGLNPGSYYLSAILQNNLPAALDPSDDRSGYAPTFYPGTGDISQAQMVTIDAGQTLSDIAIMLRPTRTASVSGIVVDAEGKIVRQGGISAMLRGMTMGVSTGGGPIRPDGTFTLNGLAPGTYILRAFTGTIAPNTPPTFSTAVVTVNGADIDNIRVEPARPVSVTGRLVIDPTSTATLQPRSVRVFANPKNPEDAMPIPGGVPPTVNEDLTFELKAFPGVVNITAMLPPGWMTSAVRHGATDVMDEGLELRGGSEVSGLEIEVTNRVATLSGSAANDRGEPTLDYSVVLFPSDGDVPIANARGGLVRADQDGRFAYRTVRPGSYYVAAIDHVDGTQWMDPAYLDALRPVATRITLGVGEAKSVDLKVLTAP